jgi:hypothetical protein
VCFGGDRLGQDGCDHVGVSARFKDDRAPHAVRAFAQPRQLLAHRAPGRGWQTLDNQTERLATNMCIHGSDPLDHRRNRNTTEPNSIRTMTMDGDTSTGEIAFIRGFPFAFSWLIVCTFSGASLGSQPRNAETNL